MKKSETRPSIGHFAEITAAVCERLAKNRRVRRTLPGKGRLRIDRQLPFLCIYRAPTDRDDAGTQDLVTSEAAYLFASGKADFYEGLNNLCQCVSATMQEHFGTFLFVEIWSHPDEETIELPLLQPAFELVADHRRDKIGPAIDVLAEALSSVSIGDHPAIVSVRPPNGATPPGLQALPGALPDSDLARSFRLGLAVRPIYRDEQTGTVFPKVLQRLRSQLARAMRKGVAEFVKCASTKADTHFESLGPTTMVKAARFVDQQLCEVSDSFDFLLQVTPTNTEAAWKQFDQGGYQAEPPFTYRPLPYDPNLLKRRLFEIEIERLEDPTLAYLFWEQQEELDRKLTALRDLNTPHFLHGSLQLYGAADDSLVQLAEDILARHPHSVSPSDDNGLLEVDEVVARAREEIDYYHQRMPEFNATVEVRNDIASGIMVSRDKLLISATLQIRAERIAPLFHHEVGTHLVTFFNGRCQPFRQLYAGLAGYDELQEGLAVFAEHLSSGLTPNRLRNLAGRVIAVRMMCDGQSFVETFDRLHEQFDLGARQAFVTTLRAFRGGGFTKDVIYLRGLCGVLGYLERGHDLEPLYVGKIGLHHLPYIQEMRRRRVIRAPHVLPRFWDDSDLRERLEASRGLSVMQLMELDE